MVEEALAARFGRPVPLRLVVDEGTTAPAAGRPARAGSPSAPGDASGALTDDELMDEDFDPDASAVDDGTSVAEARLLEFFPGAEEVSD